MKTMTTKGLKVLLLTLILASTMLPNSVYADGGFGSEIKEDLMKEIRIIKEEKQDTEDIEVRYPNKLVPKVPTNENASNNSEKANTNKGIRTEQSNARATVTENVDNANKEYPIYHGISKKIEKKLDDEDTKNPISRDNIEDAEKEMEKEPTEKEESKYAADARQFITFMTKNGKTFHLIINHDEESENVVLLTEVSEDDLLNMVEVKEKKEVVKKPEEKPVKTEPVKEEKKDNLSTYLIVFLVVGAAIIGGYYFKVHKKKEEEELLSFEEPDDGFIAEAKEINENGELDDNELL